MITDLQVRKLLKYLSQGKSLETASARSGMDEKTARKYRNLNRLPSQIKAERFRRWRTRNDPLGELWQTAKSFLENNPGLEAKGLFTYLRRTNPERISGSQLRTFQRRVKSWRATESHEVFFPKRHGPGRMSRGAFLDLSALQVRLAGQTFDHLVYHFVLCHSNWETGTICGACDFGNLGEGLQRSLWELGGVPQGHSTAGFARLAEQMENPVKFLRSYQALLDHYGLTERPRRPDSREEFAFEQRHRRFEKALDQALTVRGSRDFGSLQEYQAFLRRLFEQLNRNRLGRLRREQMALRRLPRRKWREDLYEKPVAESGVSGDGRTAPNPAYSGKEA